MHNIHNAKWCDVFYWTQQLHPLQHIIKHTECSRWLSSTGGNKREWKSSELAHVVTYPITWGLHHQECMCYLVGTDTVKSPTDLSCIFQLHLTCSKGVWTSESFALHYIKAEVYCRRWLLWDWGVKNGKHDNGYTSVFLWAQQWPSCLLTFPPLAYKSFPERFIGLTCRSLSSLIWWVEL